MMATGTNGHDRLQGKVALVTGGARGMGAAESRLFAMEGAKVALTDVLDTEGEAVAAEINAAGGQARYFHLDVSSAEQWAETTAGIEREFGGLDILVNNAGIAGNYADIVETPLEDWEKVISVNQTGSFLGIKHAVPLMRKRQGGSVIQIASIFGSRGVPVAAAYCTSKGAVALMAKNAAMAFAEENIRVNAIHPGIIDTPIVAAQTDEMNESVVDATPMKRMGRPSEVAQAALFLASDDSSFVTGCDLFVDGGYNAKGQNT